MEVVKKIKKNPLDTSPVFRTFNTFRLSAGNVDIVYL